MNKAVYIDCSTFVQDFLDDDFYSLIPDIKINVGDPSRGELESLLSGAIGVLNGHTNMDRALLKEYPLLKTIVYLGTGASSFIDLKAADELGITVRTIRNYGDRTVAEHAFALILAAARQIAAMDRGVRAGKWDPLPGIELYEKTLGVIGAGAVGRELVRIASAFGMKTCAWSRNPKHEDLPGKYVDLDELLATSDVVSLHLSLNEDTRGFIDASRIAAMRSGVIFVNTARGALVDERALIDALRSKHIAHAALDVFETEPVKPNYELVLLPNVTLTAHAAFKTLEATRRLTRMGFLQLRSDLDAIAAGQSLAN